MAYTNEALIYLTSLSDNTSTILGVFCILTYKFRAMMDFLSQLTLQKQ